MAKTKRKTNKNTQKKDIFLSVLKTGAKKRQSKSKKVAVNSKQSVGELRKTLKQALVKLKQYRQKYWIQTMISVFLIVALVISVYQEPPTEAVATSPWSQTNWSGGESSGTVTDTVTTYDSQSSIDTTLAGQFSLDKDKRIATFKGNQLLGGSTNFNIATKTALSFNTSQVYEDTHFSFSGGSPSRLVVDQNGDYFISFTMPIVSQCVTASRNAIEAEVRVNGVKQDVGLARSTYIRNYSGNCESSAHLAVLLEGLSINDYIEVYVARSTSLTSNTLTGDFTFYSEFVPSSATAFNGTATRTVASTNLNGAESELQWTETREDTGYTHSTGSHQIQIDADANYFVAVNVPVGGTVQRSNLIGRVKLNDATVSGGIFQQGYIRSYDNHYDSSMHWTGVIQATNGQDLTITLQQEAASGTVTVDSNKATLYVQKLPNTGVYVGTSTTVNGGTNWNPTSEGAVDWTDVIDDDSTYTHNTGATDHIITVLEDGDYLVAYNQAQTGAFDRGNPRVRIKVNDILVTGAQSLTGYVRNSGGHNSSSNNILFPLVGLSANDEISITVQAEAVTGTLDDDTPSQIMIWKNGFASSGNLVSNVYDSELANNWGMLTYNSSGTGTVAVKARSDNSSDMSGAEQDWGNCNNITSGFDISTNNCVDDTERYFQYYVELQPSGGETPIFEDISLSYAFVDVTEPTNPDTLDPRSENGGVLIASDTWLNHDAPYFEWSGAVDAAGGEGFASGVAGYYVYFGTNNSADPEISGNYQADTNYTGSSLVSGETYYLRIKAVDAARNVASTTWAPFNYVYDGTAPNNPSGVLPNPAGFSNANDFSFTWNTGSDGDSGISEYCYKTGADGAVDTCQAGTSVLSIQAYQEGTNVFYVRSKDVAGNMLDYYTSVNYYYSANAPSEPQNLQVTPSENTENSFTFSWLEPVTYSNPIKGYHYSINAIPNADNSTYTTSNSIGPDAFATQQGVNVFYIIAEDSAGNKEWTAYSSIEFTASTSAPGMPTGVIVTDSSNRENGSFRLTVTWEEPDDVGGGIDHYVVERNPDEEGNDVWTEISQVSGTGYLDTGLTQNDWYSYRVYAADSANAVSAASTEITEQARGRYYEAPSLVGTPGVNVRIQSAVVEWLTDREGSSFVEYGETTTYGEETGKDNFVSAHQVTLTDLEPATTYHYRVRWTDEDNNTGYSTDSTFTTADALSAPTNLVVDPAYNTKNLFSFSWDAPIDEGVEVQGYFYSINSTPTDQNTSFTASTSIGPGPYATQQGTNTFYVVAIDDDNNINYGNYASIDFEAETKAPTIPVGLIITDSSNRDHKVYSITLVWEEVISSAQAEGEDEIVYIIERSVDEDDEFEPIAETTSYGYLDVGLDNTKEHFYKVKAKDTAGATSAASSTVSEIPEGRFTSPPEITTGPNIEPDSFSATITWGTERIADSHIEYGLTETLGEEQGTIEENEDHTVVLEGLNPETKYFYRVRSRDEDGNIALSNISEFTTLEAPRVSEVEAKDVKLFNALITWETNKPTTTRIDYGTSTNYGFTVADTSGSLTTTHTMKLENLTDGTLYHYRPTGFDSSGNSPESSDYSFTTLTFPEVLTVEFENKSQGQTEVRWTTNVPTSSEVEYYNDAIAPKTQGNSAQVREHVVLLFGLEDATTYLFRVKGFDQFGYQAISEENTFTTLEDTTPPEISGVQSESNTIGSGEESTIQIIISWKTNEPTTSQVEYGVGLSGSDYSDQSEENAELVMDHLVVIGGLSPAKTYHFRAVARDKAGNQTKSGSYTVLTSRKRESFLQLVISNLEETFSWVGNVF